MVNGGLAQLVPLFSKTAGNMVAEITVHIECGEKGLASATKRTRFGLQLGTHRRTNVPVLQAEPALYPEDLLESATGESPDRRWWVLHTKPRQEKATSRELLAHQVPYYLPLVKKRISIRSRVIFSYIPLFTGYVFIYGTEQERIRALTTNRITRILAVHAPDRLLDDLRQLRQLITSGAPLTVESRLTGGSRVRVRSGVLAGLEGTVLTRRSKTRLLVGVNFLQQGASVEIEDFLLEPIE